MARRRHLTPLQEVFIQLLAGFKRPLTNGIILQGDLDSTDPDHPMNFDVLLWRHDEG